MVLDTANSIFEAAWMALGSFNIKGISGGTAPVGIGPIGYEVQFRLFILNEKWPRLKTPRSRAVVFSLAGAPESRLHFLSQIVAFSRFFPDYPPPILNPI